MTGFKPGDRVFHPALIREGTVIETRTSISGTNYLVQLDNLRGPSECPAATLEPLGEPMSNAPDFFAEPGSHHGESIVISKADLPVVGRNLGGTADEAWGRALIALAVHEQLRADEAAADREALDADAWKLYVAGTPGHLNERFELLALPMQEKWRAVASAARELRGVTA